jgi:hypothetical protein
MELLHWLEQTSLSIWVRESPSVLAFPSILLLHTLSMACVVGISAGMNLRILGFAPQLRLAPLEKFFPLVWAGIWVSAITGSVLVMQDAATKLINPDFYVKMVFVAAAIILLRTMRSRVLRDPTVDTKPFSSSARWMAIVSLLCWVGAITSGRLLAYVGPVPGL